LLDRIREGASIRQAAALVGAPRRTVTAWLASGRSPAPKHPEHRAFAEALEEALAAGTHEVVKTLAVHAKTDYRAALAILAARDERFGAAAAHARRVRAEIRAAEAQARLLTARVAALEKVASGEGATLVFGLADLLDDEGLAFEVRQALARRAVDRGWIALAQPEMGEPTGAPHA